MRILTEEGYGVLGGELLTEIGLGRELDEADDDEDDDGWNPEADDLVPLDDDVMVRRLYRDRDGGGSPPPPSHEPMTDEEQLQAAADFVTSRLVEPLRRLAEAERMAGLLASLPEPPPDPAAANADVAVTPTQDGGASEIAPTAGEGSAIRIAFSDRPQDDEGVSAAEPGGEEALAGLTAVLERLRVRSA